jgi:hypothetical protein
LAGQLPRPALHRATLQLSKPAAAAVREVHRRALVSATLLLTCGSDQIADGLDQVIATGTAPRPSATTTVTPQPRLLIQHHFASAREEDPQLSAKVSDNRPGRQRIWADVGGRETHCEMRRRPGQRPTHVASGRRGRRFKSCHPDTHRSPVQTLTTSERPGLPPCPAPDPQHFQSMAFRPEGQRVPGRPRRGRRAR